LAAILGAALAWSATASAQTLESGQIRGIVYDETKAALPGATVTLTNAATGFTRSVATNAAGAYSFAQLPTGTYGMRAELSGFAPFKREGIVVESRSIVRIDISLSLNRQAAEQVEVVAAALVVALALGDERIVGVVEDHSSVPSRVRKGRVGEGGEVGSRIPAP